VSSVDAFAARNAVECLRAGVPNPTVVELLGSGQPRIEDAFTRMLTAVREGATTGLCVGGGFGAGKSHLLAALRQRALREGFAVSTVVISKETLLSDPAKVAGAALATATARDRRGPLLVDLAAELDPASRARVDLRRWAEDAEDSGLDGRFAATLDLHAHAHGVDEDLADAVVRFWSGHSLPATDLARALRANGLPAPRFQRVHAADLARQRLRFAQRLMTAAGHRGWIVLFDEVELIGRCTPAQRARSYAEIARWTGGALGGPAAIGSVFAITEDFTAAVLDGKGDRDTLAKRDQRAEFAGLVAEGMRVIDRDTLLLDRPDPDRLQQVYRRVRELHGAAFNWSPPHVRGVSGAGSHQFRQHIRGWINEWDLLRLDPGYRPDTFLDPRVHDYSHA
jgi:hypothetical protein